MSPEDEPSVVITWSSATYLKDFLAYIQVSNMVFFTGNSKLISVESFHLGKGSIFSIIGS